MRPLFTCVVVCVLSVVAASTSSDLIRTTPDELPPPRGPFPWPIVAQGSEEPPAEADGTRRPVLSRRELCEVAATAAETHGLPIPFFIRLIWQESRFDAHAVSPAGALGVAQFMPQVAAELGLPDPFHPVDALFMSARFLRSLVERFGNLGLAAAAYNAGARRVLDWLENRGQLPEETRQYVHKITGAPPADWARKDPPAPVLTVPERTECAEIAAQRAPSGLDDSVGAVASGLVTVGRSFARLAPAAGPRTPQKQTRVALGRRSSRAAPGERAAERKRTAKVLDRRERRAARHAQRRDHLGGVRRGKLALSGQRVKQRSLSTAGRVEPRQIRSRSAAARRSRVPARG
jgi:hypothetical protein